ncbi:hypothetical protein A7K50_03390 [Dehalobacter sp. MCB1]|uniref:hypothetical protein n=1 Tax=Dehalobacter sp. MCB1 TaxID=1844756 RepID=UPI000E6CD738|nr:hypothetical protein [Dehalobacter sp. MCB1]RJE47705.1 hypothetical protein A7K50_03390 [Dehalobacter sp. MCB1]
MSDKQNDMYVKGYIDGFEECYKSLSRVITNAIITMQYKNPADVVSKINNVIAAMYEQNTKLDDMICEYQNQHDEIDYADLHHVVKNGRILTLIINNK